MRNLDTPAARKHFLYPKPNPRSWRARMIPEDMVHFLTADLTTAERKAMAQIAETADLLDTDAGAYLLVPADGKLLDTLAAFGAGLEDREMDDVGEDDDADEHDDREPDHDNEYDFRGPQHDMTRHDKPPLPNVKEVDGIVWVGERRAS